MKEYTDEELDAMTDEELAAVLAESNAEVRTVELDARCLVAAHGVLFGNLDTMDLCYKLSNAISDTRRTYTLQLTRREIFDILKVVHASEKAFRAEKLKAKAAGDIDRAELSNAHMWQMRTLDSELSGALFD